MKLFFSEYKSDYDNYIFPYAIWAVPEAGEKPSLVFDKGFLPNSRQLDRFYMCRHIRVDLRQFSPSSENRRILRKGEKFSYQLIDKIKFNFSLEWERFCLSYAEQRFGPKVMTSERLRGLVASPIVSHFLVFSLDETPVGIVFLYLEAPEMAFYYFSFYDLAFQKDSLGMYMMTSAVKHFAEAGFGTIYLGSCYSRSALYKTQFSGAQFWNGFAWSENLKELKYLIERDNGKVDKHLLENDEFIDQYWPDGVARPESTSKFHIK